MKPRPRTLPQPLYDEDLDEDLQLEANFEDVDRGVDPTDMIEEIEWLQKDLDDLDVYTDGLRPQTEIIPDGIDVSEIVQYPQLEELCSDDAWDSDLPDGLS